MSHLSQQDLDEIYAFAVDLGRKAGQLLLESVEKRIAGNWDQEVEEKENAVDIVTQTDEGILLFTLLIDGNGANHGSTNRGRRVHQECASREISLSQVSSFANGLIERILTGQVPW